MNEDDDNTLIARASRVLLPAMAFAVGFGMLFGALGGGAAAIAKQGALSWPMLVIVPIGLIGAAIMVVTFRKWPTLQMGEPDTPRTRRLGFAMIGLIAFAAVTSLFFVVGDGDAVSVELYSNGPLPFHLALGAALLWLIGLPVLTYLTRRNADEVNLEHQRFGETIGFHFLAVAAPVWWLGYRGGFMPQPDVMILFIAVLIVSVIGNFIRRL